MFECEPNSVYKRIMSICGTHRAIVVIEDIFPFSNRLTPSVIDTCKLIGELTYRFNTTENISVKLIPRNTVRNWIFKTVPDVVTPRVIKKMVALDARIVKNGGKGLRNKEGKFYDPHFKFVDDRTVIAALKSIYNIPTPKPGKPNIFGLKNHSWQALAAASFYRYSNQHTAGSE